jgi:hypothetical protein
MKTIFDEATRKELIGRINALKGDNAAQWGKMNIYQMLKHCTLWEQMIAGEVSCKRVFLGRIIGKWALKNAVKDETPMMINAISSPELIVHEATGDIAAQKSKWIVMIEKNAGFPAPVFMHPFFGEMTKEQLGYFIYKHHDHHLRQFGG